jgi:Ser/Thr protein kinase RdoA (MazF antagonist)
MDDRGQTYGALRTLATPATTLTDVEAEGVASAVWGLHGTARRLAGETDDNFLLRADTGSYFLKVAHPAEHPQVVDLHTKLLQVLRGVADVRVQEVVPSLEGELNPTLVTPSGDRRMARLTTFLDGRPIKEVRADARLREDVGRTLARIAQELASFTHPAAEWPLVWDLWQAESVRPMLAELEHLDGHRLLAEALDRFSEVVRPVLARQRRQMVHNDFNGDNVLVSEDGATVAGVIDFGDGVVPQVVNDVASAMCNHLVPGPDPLGPAIDVLRGYQRVRRLEPEEVGLLYDLTRLRVAMRIAITDWRAVRFPANRAYILRSTPRAWAVLESVPLSGVPAGTQRLMEVSGWA